MNDLRLTEAELDAIASRVVDLLAESQIVPLGLVDADTVARHLSVEREWIYDNATRLGALRLGDGPKARLRFDLAEVDRRLATSCPAGRESHEPTTRSTTTKRRPRRHPSLGTTVPLLPIRGEKEGERRVA